jgi:type IV pilus assembly protein PilM
VRFTKPKKVIGLDIGTHAVKVVQMSRSGDGLVIEDIGYALVDRNRVSADPVSAQADALREALEGMPSNQCLVVGALPGQTVVIRYPRLKKLPAAEMDAAIEAEARHNIPYDLAEVFLDWSLLDEESEGDETNLKVLLVAAKHDVIDTRMRIAQAADVAYGVLSVDSLALADAAEGAQLLSATGTTALINIGASSVSIHFTKNGSSNFIRDINWGARELIQTIAKARRCDYEHAEAILVDYDAEVAQGRERAAPAATPAKKADSNNAALLNPLEEELGDQPAAVEDYTAPTPLDEILAIPVSRFVAEVRRSFDYYEHQLYEHPVDRIVLSGGIAHLTPIREALKNDLDVENVILANPAEGSIRLGRNVSNPQFEEHPAQFMVAVGLAARGAADL